jgi:hypothetical protein
MVSANNKKLIERYIYPCGDGESSEFEEGLLLSGFLTEGLKQYDLQKVFELEKGGIIIAEAGMGKTTFVEQLKDKFSENVELIKLGEYSNDPSGLKNDVSEKNQQKKEKITVLIFDGLDEALDLAGVLKRTIRNLREENPELKIWLASRYVPQIDSIAKEFDFNFYNLAPLSEQDIIQLAVYEGIQNQNDFLKIIKKQDLIDICRKPQGCLFAIRSFLDGKLKEDSSGKDLWRDGIRGLCEEEREKNKKNWVLDEIVKCAAWLALCLEFSEKNIIWLGETTACPEQCLDSESCVVKESSFSIPLINDSLKRGVFTPIGDNKVRFSHKSYFDYLVAYGMILFVSAKNRGPLLLNGERNAVFPQRSAIAEWLTAFDDDFCKLLIDIQPELLLSYSYREAVQFVGAAELCSRLLKRADEIGHREIILGNLRKKLFRLKSPEVQEAVKNFLSDDRISDAEFELGVFIAEACDFSDLAGLLMDVITTSTASEQKRIVASYVVKNLKCKKEDYERLRIFLPEASKAENNYEVLGCVLSALWPENLSVDELLEVLIPPRAGYVGSYSSFLSYELPASFESYLTLQNAQVFLDWAYRHIHDDESKVSSYLGDLASYIFTFCWQWAKEDESVTSFLAKCYKKANSVHLSPFTEQISSRNSGIFISEEDFENDFERRFAVLENLIEQQNASDSEIRLIPYGSGLPLFTERDIKNLLRTVPDKLNGEHAEIWADILNMAIRYQPDLSEYKNEIGYIHESYPNLISAYQEFQNNFDDGKKERERIEGENLKRQQARQAKEEKKQNEIDQWVKTAIQKENLSPSYFGYIADNLNSGGGCSFVSHSLDVQQYNGWNKLSLEEQIKLISMAERYLIEIPIETVVGSARAGAQALILLRKANFEAYQKLSHDVWKKWAVELIKIAAHDKESIEPLLDTLAADFPEVAEKALIELINQQLKEEAFSAFASWGTRLNEKQAKSVLKIVQSEREEVDVFKKYGFLRELVRLGQKNIVIDYLDDFFEKQSSPPDSQWNKYLELAFCLNPEIYAKKVLDFFGIDKNWGRQWLKSSIGSFDPFFGNISEWEFPGNFWSCKSDLIADFFVRLRTEYPVPPERKGVYTPDVFNKIGTFKSMLINHLIGTGTEESIASLKKIQQTFPECEWLKDCIIEVQKKHREREICFFSIDEIKELYTKRQDADCRLILSAVDLSDLVLESLEQYQTYLQEQRAVNDLWNMRSGENCPKNEESFSDHISRYLKLKINPQLIINREVQIQRKLYEDDEPGSRTDLWIQITNKNKSILTLCIEVKCSWNRSAKTALKDQLVEQYMKKHSNIDAGILLLGWYKRSATWPDPQSAREKLEKQVEETRNATGKNVKAIVIDCSI